MKCALEQVLETEIWTLFWLTFPFHCMKPRHILQENLALITIPFINLDMFLIIMFWKRTAKSNCKKSELSSLIPTYIYIFLFKYINIWPIQKNSLAVKSIFSWSLTWVRLLCKLTWFQEVKMSSISIPRKRSKPCCNVLICIWLEEHASLPCLCTSQELTTLTVLSLNPTPFLF